MSALQSIEEQLGQKLTEHSQSFEAERQAILERFAQQKRNERHRIQEELERVRARMGLAAARAPRPPAAEAEEGKDFADVGLAMLREVREKRMEASESELEYFDPHVSGALMGSPMDEQPGRRRARRYMY